MNPHNLYKLMRSVGDHPYIGYGFIAFVGGILTFSSSWLIIEIGMSNGQIGNTGAFVLFSATYTVPLGVTAWLIRRTEAARAIVAVHACLTVAILLGYWYFESEPVFLLSFLLFTIPAFVVGRINEGLLPAVVLSYVPVAGMLFAIPMGQVGTPTLIDRLLTSVIFGVPVVLAAIGLYVTGRRTGPVDGRNLADQPR